MKKVFFAFLSIAIFYTVLHAQNTNSDPTAGYKVSGETYLGDKSTKGKVLSMSLDSFNNLITQPIYVKDNEGVFHPVIRFSFNYAERALYQDTLGKPIIVSDYLGTTIDSSQLSQDFTQDLLTRTKEKDTAFIMDVTYTFKDKADKKLKVGYGNTMKIIIHK